MKARIILELGPCLFSICVGVCEHSVNLLHVSEERCRAKPVRSE